jgi:hypothetical protein
VGAEPDRLISGIGGTGSGTGLVGAGLTVGPETNLGRILLFVSPVTSVVVGSVFFHLHMNLNRWFETRAAGRARRALEEAISSPHLPEEAKARFRLQLVQFEESVVARELERVRLISALPELGEGERNEMG